jgi:hypothetical protein
MVFLKRYDTMRKVLKIILYSFGGIIVLLAGTILWIISPSGKRFVRTKAVSFLHNKLKTEVYIGAIEYSFPKMIGLKDVLFKDQQQDTLLSVHELRIDVDMLALLSKKISVNQLLIDRMYAHVYRNMPDTTYNFTYIIDAFATKDPKPVDTSTKDKSSPFVFDVGRVKLDEIHVRFEDETGGMHLAVDLKHLAIKMRELDPGKMVFRLKSLEVQGLQTSFRQDTSYIVSHDTAKSAMPTIALDELKLQQIAVQFNSTVSNFGMDVQLNRLEAHPQKIDLQGQDIRLKDLLMDTTTAKIVVGKSSEVPKKIDNVVDTIAQQSWKMTAGLIDLKRINVQMDNEGRPRQASGIDYAHLAVSELNFKANNINYAGDAVSGDIRHLSLKEQSGLDLQELRTVFAYGAKGAYLHGLYVQTSHSLLQDNIEVAYPSLDALKNNLQQLQLKVNLVNSVVGAQDILIFAPQLAQQDFFRANSTGRFKLDAGLDGYLNNLAIHQFRLSGLNNTYVALSGRLSGLPDAQKINYDLNIQKLQSSREDIAGLVPPKALVAIRLPNLFSLNGKVSGNTKDYNTLLWLRSTDGNAFIKGTIAMSGGKGKESYDLLVQTQQLNVGRIIRKDTLIGPVTADLKVKGRSFDVKSMTAALDGSVKSALLKGYNYNGITFKGDVANQHGNITLNSVDSNARLNMTASADFAGQYPGLVTHIHIDNIDFQALKLSPNSLKLQTDIDADLPVLNPDYPDGTILIDRPVVATGNKFYLLDSLYIVSKPSADSGQNINLNLEFLQANITGQLPLTKAGAVITEHINRHYSMLPAGRADSAKAAAPVAAAKTKPVAKTDTAKILPAVYSLNVKASLEETPSLYAFVPQLKSMDTVKIDAHVDQNSLGLNLLAPRVVYGTNLLQKATVVVNERDSGLTYNIGLEKFESGKIQLINTSVKGNVAVNLVNASVRTNDVGNKERFAFDLSLQKQDSAQALQLGSNLLLNYKQWTVSQPNKIVFGPGGFYIDNFKLSSAASSIAVSSTPPAYNAPLAAEIQNFYISDLTSLISSDTLFADGVLSGKATVQQFKPTLAFDADFRLDNLVVLKDTVGNVALTAATKDGNAINATVNISGQQNDVQLAGNYYMTTPVNGNEFDFDLALKALNLQSIEGLAQHQIRNSSGFVRGDLKINGTIKAPSISGELHTDKLKTNIKMLNSDFSMPQEKIVFTETGVAFQRFNIIDSSGNKMTLNGGVKTQDYRAMTLDLNVNARNWRASHSTQADNKLFYGDLYLTTRLDIEGPLTKPDVSGNINIEKGTKMSFALPESSQGFEDQAGVVVFTDEKTEELKRRLHLQEAPDTMKALTVAPGSDININISTDEKAEFNVVIDQATGDFLRVRGKASLNTAIDPGGNLSLNGVYELNEGNYELNYNFIKRRFIIQKGGTITFAGDPLNAEVDVKAVYVTNVAPYDLVERQVPDPAQLVYYRQQLPFNVVLSMKGPLMQPYLGFDITLPENNAYRMSADAVELVQAKLGQLRIDTSELNKQVFALLLLNRFITDDPFSSDNGGGFAFTAKQSVSRFIGEQLNQFANQLVKGVDLSVDLASTEDYTTGERRERTDLNVAASKRLLDDRLKITVGNNFELEGPQTTNNNQNSSLIPGNLAADYNLTQDGRYAVRGYRVSQDRGVIQGFVTETGVNFIVTLDYNKFRNLFIKRKKLIRDQKQDQSEMKDKPGEKTKGATN